MHFWISCPVSNSIIQFQAIYIQNLSLIFFFRHTVYPLHCTCLDPWWSTQSLPCRPPGSHTCLWSWPWPGLVYGWVPLEAHVGHISRSWCESQEGMGEEWAGMGEWGEKYEASGQYMNKIPQGPCYIKSHVWIKQDFRNEARKNKSYNIKGEASPSIYADWVNDFRNLSAKVWANLDNPIKSFDFSKFY